MVAPQTRHNTVGSVFWRGGTAGSSIEPSWFPETFGHLGKAFNAQSTASIAIFADVFIFEDTPCLGCAAVAASSLPPRWARRSLGSGRLHLHEQAVSKGSPEVYTRKLLLTILNKYGLPKSNFQQRTSQVQVSDFGYSGKISGAMDCEANKGRYNNST